MDTTLYVSLSQQLALQRKLDVIANNIANLDTTAFRREGLRFNDYIMRMKGADDPLGGRVQYVQDYGVVRDFQDGGQVPTGNSLDVAIQGPAFLMVETPRGETRYTRNGHLKLNDQGELATANGSRVLDDQGNPIRVGAGAGDLTISPDGTVSTGLGVGAQLALMEFRNPQALKKVGDSLYSAVEQPTQSAEATVHQGFIETSNVNGVEEVTEMIKVLRTYQTTAKMMDDYQQLRSRAIQRLAKVH